MALTYNGVEYALPITVRSRPSVKEIRYNDDSRTIIASQYHQWQFDIDLRPHWIANKDAGKILAGIVKQTGAVSFLIDVPQPSGFSYPDDLAVASVLSGGQSHINLSSVKGGSLNAGLFVSILANGEASSKVYQISKSATLLPNTSTRIDVYPQLHRPVLTDMAVVIDGLKAKVQYTPNMDTNVRVSERGGFVSKTLKVVEVV